MEIIVPLLFAALVLVGVVCTCFLVTAQPIWGMIDVAVSEKHSGVTKALVILFTLVLLGPIMTFLYACFGTHSKALRGTTLTAFALLMISGASALGLLVGVPAAKKFWPRLPGSQPATGTRNNARAPALPASAAFSRFPADEVVPFTAVHLLPKDHSGWSFALAEFTGHGPKPDSVLALVARGPYPITHLATDPSGPVHYAITTHEVGKIVPTTGQFVQLALDPAVGKPSWPSAIAFDTQQGVLLIAARSVGYSYKPSTGEWQKVPGLEDDNLVALAYDAEESALYALRSEPGGELATKLLTLTSHGAVLAQTALSRPIPIGRYPFCLAQLCWSGNQLIVLVSPQEGCVGKALMYSVDPKSGRCSLVE